MDSNRERDACGIGFVADFSRPPCRRIVESALEGLCNLRHRGAAAADALTGDGAGMLLPIPEALTCTQARALGEPSPDADFLGIAALFTWREAPGEHRPLIEQACAAEGIAVAGWREVPVEPSALGERARATAPLIEHALLLRPLAVTAEDAELRALRARRRAEIACREARVPTYFASFSFRTVTYKALCSADQLATFYADLADEGVRAQFAIFHQRFSTNTTPSWERAQPFRMICHNGEINTIEGNLCRMRARAGRLGKADLLDEEILRETVDTDGSDSAILDNVVELLTREGREISHGMAMLIPAAWENESLTSPAVRDFYRYHSALMEPWDGPAAVVFTDGARVGARLDRNGLRPLRLGICEDGFVACASEAGAIDLRGHGMVRRSRLGPGDMVIVGPEGVETDPIERIARARPWGEWVATHLTPTTVMAGGLDVTPDDLRSRQVTFGYTKEEFTSVIRPMALTGHEPTSSMGDDTAVAVLAPRSRPIYNYFKQRFAQVTNPPIDHLRERRVMSTRTLLGPRDPVLWERPEGAALLELDSFLLTRPIGGRQLDATFPVADGPKGLQDALDSLTQEAADAARQGGGVLVVTDLGVSEERAPVPMLLAAGAVHQSLLRAGQRMRVSIVAETDEVRDIHQFACLLAFGAEAVHPRLALASIANLAHTGRLGDGLGETEAIRRYRAAVEEGMLKVLSKMGISTVASYQGSQMFDCIGLDREVTDRCFSGTSSAVGGSGFRQIATAVLQRHFAAYRATPILENPGHFKHRSGGEYHETNPEVVGALHAAVESGEWADYARFASLVGDRIPTEPRDLLRFKRVHSKLALEEVEPVESITPRFSSGAISHGAIGAEAHETLALAMHSVGGRANTGEGGEDRRRYRDARNSSIKQIASGRFGVTPEYCAFADELQIKMAQGSKPGEGGQLPAHKVTDEIARLRHTVAGTELISPPPHHDIYSIEDLAQLIFDLKQVNPGADVSVKLVSETGVGVVAAGVVKALADVVQISGWDGGTGASPLSSIKNAGLPWELGLADIQQTLIGEDLRSRVRIRVDGGMKSGRDVVIAALLGADEYSFGTSVLLAEGCIMVRACHRDTCPVGIATQRLDLRAKFTGTPAKVAAYLEFVAEDARRILASLGLKTMEDAVGRSDLLEALSEMPEDIDLSRLVRRHGSRGRFDASGPPSRPLSALGRRLHDEALPALEEGRRIALEYVITNRDRAVGAALGGAVARRFGDDAPPGFVAALFTGVAGQSFGAFLSAGIDFKIIGEVNDGLGKAMGGGRLAVVPPSDDLGDPYLAGNAVLYGATGGRLFVAGRAGERFAVRNSGACAVAEGTGDHACEYMTGGLVVLLGPTGRNACAGMTGGRALFYDPRESLRHLLNDELVEAGPARGQDEADLLEILAEHAEITASPVALAILQDWERNVRHFKLVAPRRIAGTKEHAA